MAIPSHDAPRTQAPTAGTRGDGGPLRAREAAA